jgi:1,2-phenylacetyl-CoA epoxidase catalytic subunit
MSYVDGSHLEERYRKTLVQMMAGQAYRELAAAHLFGYGLPYVRELRWLKLIVWHIREEISHYEAVSRMYRAFAGESIEPLVRERLASRPLPSITSFYDLAMAQFLYDRGGLFQLREYEECSFVPYREVIRKILEEERGHQALGERIVVELSLAGECPGEKQVIFEKWLRQGLLSFGRPYTEGARYAIEVGLRKRDPSAVMQDYINDIKPAVKACGLVLPRLDKIGIDAPPGGIDLSMPAP